MAQWFWAILLITIGSGNVSTETALVSLTDIIGYLSTGEKSIEFNDNYKNVTLILGNSGEGKTSLALLITGDINDLIAVKVSPGKYRIDHTKIGSEATVSKTKLPELMVYEESNVVYDCPGFNDAGNIMQDIGTSYFIRKVLDESDYVKLVLVASEESVDGSRLEFSNLLNHVTDMFKDVVHFCESIALVVTKVKNLKEDDVLIDDHELIEGFAGSLRKRLSEVDRTGSYRNRQSAVRVMQCLLKKTNGIYDKIGIFRVPAKEGPLGQSPLLISGKAYIREVIEDKLTFASIDMSTINYTVSSNTQITLTKLVKQFNDDILERINQATNHLADFYSRYQFDVSAPETGDLLNSFYKALNVFTGAIGQTTSGRQFLTYLKPLAKLTTADSNLVELVQQDTNLKIIEDLEVVTNTHLESSPTKWIIPFKAVSDKIVHQTDLSMDDNLAQVVKLYEEIFEETQDHFSSLSELPEVDSQLKDGYESLSQLIHTATNGQNSRDYLIELEAVTKEIGINNSTENTVQLLKRYDYYLALQDISRKPVTEDPKKLVHRFEALRKIVSDTAERGLKTLNTQIEETLAVIANQLNDTYRPLLSKQSFEELQTPYSVLKTLIKDTAQFDSSYEYLNHIATHENQLNLDRNYLNSLNDQLKFLSFSKQLNEKVLKSWRADWRAPFQTIVDNVNQQVGETMKQKDQEIYNQLSATVNNVVDFYDTQSRNIPDKHDNLIVLFDSVRSGNELTNSQFINQLRKILEDLGIDWYRQRDEFEELQQALGYQDILHNLSPSNALISPDNYYLLFEFITLKITTRREMNTIANRLEAYAKETCAKKNSLREDLKRLNCTIQLI